MEISKSEYWVLQTALVLLANEVREQELYPSESDLHNYFSFNLDEIEALHLKLDQERDTQNLIEDYIEK